MARKPIEVVGGEFYDTNPIFLREFEEINRDGIDTTDARYLDPETGEVKNYTAQQILDQNAPSGLYTQGLNVPTDSRNYVRLLTLRKILNTPDLLNQVVSTGQITEDVLRQDYDDEARSRYTDELRPYYDKGGVFVDQEYTPRPPKEDYTGSYIDPKTGETVEYTIAGEDLSVTGNPALDYLYDTIFEANERQREQYLLRGVKSKNLDTSYLQRTDMPAEYEARLAQSPPYPTGREYANIIRPFDPPNPNRFNPKETLPVVSEVVPGDPSQGLTIKSIYNGVDEETGDYRVLPVENIQPVQTAFQGDFDPIKDEIARFVAVEGAGILAGMGIVGFAQKVARNRINKNLKETAADLESGLLPGEGKRRSDALFSLDTAKDIGYTTLGAASGEAAVKFTALSLGAVPKTDEEGNIVEPAVQPDMTFSRAAKESFALFQAAMIGGVAGDTVLRGFASAWKTLTGIPVDSAVMDQLILESRILGDKIRGTTTRQFKTDQLDRDRARILEVLQDSEYYEPELTLAQKIANQTPDTSVKKQKEVGQQTAIKIAKILKERKQTIGQMSQNDFILALEEVIGADMLAGSPEFVQLQNFARGNAIVLDEFYRTLTREFEGDPSAFVSKERVNELFTGARTDQLLKELSEEEAALLSARADASLNSVLNSPTREARQAAAADVQEQVSISQSSLFPDQKSRLLVERDQEIQAARADLDEIISQEQYTGPEGSTKMPRFIAASLEDFLNANKQRGTPFGTTEGAEAEQVIREILPYQREGFNIAAYLGQERVKKVDADGKPIIDPSTGKQAEGLLLPQQAIPLDAQIRMRENIASVVRGHPNSVVREKGQALLDSVDRMIDHSIGKVYKARTGNNPEDVSMDEVYSVVGGDYLAAREALDDVKSEVSGRFLRDIVTRPENEIGSFILTSNPDQVRGLISSISRQEGGLQKLQSIRELVLESLQKQTDNQFAPDAAKTDQAAIFSNLLNRHEEQLRALFPEDFVKFTEMPALLESAREAVKQSNARIQVLNRELEDLSVDGKIPSITDTLDMFFGLSSMQARQANQTKIQKAVKAIGEIADEYPDLRAALQGYFGEEILNKQLRMPDYQAATPAARMLTAAGEDSPFNFNNLNRIFLQPYNNDRELANALEPIVGKSQAFRYAKDLRILARQMRQQKGFARSPVNELAMRPEVKEMAAEAGGVQPSQNVLDTVRKLVYGPLDITSTRLGILGRITRASSNERARQYLARIVQDPQKLRTFMAIKERQLPVLTTLKVMGTIAYGRSENIGSEVNLDEADRLREEIREIEGNDTLPAAIQRLFEDE